MLKPRCLLSCPRKSAPSDLVDGDINRPAETVVGFAAPQTFERNGLARKAGKCCRGRCRTWCTEFRRAREGLDRILCDVPGGQINRVLFSRIPLRHRRFFGQLRAPTGRDTV
jgi:hypothetical protein